MDTMHLNTMNIQLEVLYTGKNGGTLIVIRRMALAMY